MSGEVLMRRIAGVVGRGWSRSEEVRERAWLYVWPGSQFLYMSIRAPAAQIILLVRRL
jgi:hypothetical protein